MSSKIEKGGPGSGQKGHQSIKKQPWDESVKDTPEYDVRLASKKEAKIKLELDKLKAEYKTKYGKEYVSKGGPGSGIKGHLTNHPELHSQKVQNLATKLNQPPNAMAAHLNMLQNGAVLEGVNLRSGKPLFLNHEQAIAHGYTSQEHREAGNVHYDRAKQMAENIEKLKMLKKPVPPEMKKIVDFHRQNFRRHFNAAERVENTKRQTVAALEAQKQKIREESSSKVKKAIEDFVEKAAKRISPEQADRCLRNLVNDGMELDEAYAHCTGKFRGKKTFGRIEKCDCESCSSMAKSVVAMSHQDGLEVDTSKFAIEMTSAMESDWLEQFHNVMDGYSFGDAPRTILLDSGDLHLVKVDDGIYSGVFKTLSPDGLEDNAKVRIERMTLPTLISFCMAKEWIRPRFQPHIIPEPISEPQPIMPPPLPVETEMDKKLRMLELVAKLIS